jgi:hypothetical protein
MLEFKPEKGLVFKQQLDVDIINEQRMGEQKVTLKNTAGIILSNTVKNNNDKHISIESRYDYLSIYFDTGMMKIQYDSNDTTAYVTSDNGGPLLRVMTNNAFTITINKNGLIENISGFGHIKQMMGSVFDIDSALKLHFIESIEKHYGDNALKANIERFTAVFPGKPVSIGDSWNIETKTFGNFIGSVKSTLALKKIKNKNAIIDYKAVLDSPAHENEIKMGDISQKTGLSGTQTGTISIDIINGLLNNANITQVLEGEIELLRIGMGTPMVIPVKQTIIIKQSLIDTP